MNAARHDIDPLRNALDELGQILQKAHELEAQRDALQREIGRLHEQQRHARLAAANALRREGGAVVHAGKLWKLSQGGYVSCEDVVVNLDAAEAARNGTKVPLQLTAPGKIA